MRIRTLSLEQFRSFPSLELDFSGAQTHVLLGPNGVGKTNILESVAVLSLTKSFLAPAEEDLIHWGEQFYRARGAVVNDQEEASTLEVVSQIAPRKQKACFINDVRIPVSDIVGHLPTVMFLPQDLELFIGPPARRRRFLDELLCQVSGEYSRALSRYQQILKQRNTLLKKIVSGVAKTNDLMQWDTLLAQQGSHVVLRRLELMQVFRCTLQREIQALGESWEEVALVYERKGTAHDLQEIQEELHMQLEHYRERDLMLQSTTVGPHRDDWHIDVSGRSLPTFASRGQQRAAVLSLIFLKVSFLELRRGEKPVVLLDDVFSELDDSHQQALLRSFNDYQVIVTATHVPPEISEAKVWDVERLAKCATQ